MQTDILTFLLSFLNLAYYAGIIFFVYFIISGILKLQKTIGRLCRQVDELQRTILDQKADRY